MENSVAKSININNSMFGDLIARFQNRFVYRIYSPRRIWAGRMKVRPWEALM